MYMKQQMWLRNTAVRGANCPAHYIELGRHYFGEDNTIFCSDWPHHDFDHPSAILSMPMSAEQRRKIMGENAVRLFNLPALSRQMPVPAKEMT